jgi:hypothetical protein
MSIIKQNKVSVKEKHVVKEAPINMADVFMNELELDPILLKELKEKGLAYRFINGTHYRKNGSHRARWIPYKRETKSELFGADPDGFVRRGDLILAVKPEQAAQMHKQLLKQRAQAQSNAVINKTHAEQFREMAKESGVKTQVSEGFGEGGEDSE